MSYRNLLNTQEWRAFRAEYIASRKNEDGDLSQCDECGQETDSPLQVHHKTYRTDVLPWEYDYGDLRLLCRDCHWRLHETETKWRAFIRSLPPHVCYEIEDFLSELQAIEDPRTVKIAFAQAKSVARELQGAEVT